MEEKQYIKIAEAHFKKHKVRYGNFWYIHYHAGWVAIWFWAPDECSVNPCCTMYNDGSNPAGPE